MFYILDENSNEKIKCLDFCDIFLFFRFSFPFLFLFFGQRTQLFGANYFSCSRVSCLEWHWWVLMGRQCKVTDSEGGEHSDRADFELARLKYFMCVIGKESRLAL